MSKKNIKELENKVEKDLEELETEDKVEEESETNEEPEAAKKKDGWLVKGAQFVEDIPGKIKRNKKKTIAIAAGVGLLTWKILKGRNNKTDDSASESTESQAAEESVASEPEPIQSFDYEDLNQ